MQALLDGDAVSRYPDGSALRLREALAEHVGVAMDQIAVGAGSVGLIEQVLRLVAGDGDEIVVGDPSFRAYSTIAQTTGTIAVPVGLSGASADLAAMARAVTPRTRAVFVCTPNNPTGGVVTTAATRALLEAIPSNVLVVVDEAYREFVDTPDAVDGVGLLADHPNVLSLRTFSKAYGLAGLRVGYAAGDPAIIDAINAVQVPFAVSAVAQRAAVASLQHRDHLAERVDAVVSERKRMRTTLMSWGHDVAESQGNFLWIPTGMRTSEITRTLAEVSVLVRPIGVQGIRVTIGHPEENDRFLDEFQKAVARVSAD